MIKYASGNLLTSSSQALVNAVNCQGVMGKGIALAFKESFPKNFEIYKKACDNGSMKIGEVLLVDEKGKIIVNFPTKDSWRKKSTYDFISQGLESLAKVMIDKKITSISIPPLGCGNGGLDWNKVEALILTTFEKMDNIEVVIYPPATNNKLSKNKNIINAKHLLVHYAYENLNVKQKFSLYSVFYICECIEQANLFSFEFKHGRPYSSELDQVMKDIANLKIELHDDFHSFIEDYINTHQSKELQSDFGKLFSTLKPSISLLNDLKNKNDYIDTVYVITRLIKEKHHSLHINDFKEHASILRNLIESGFVAEDIFNELRIRER
jgi:O-acetyl-ADP-ribose deacetylase (regulator of RNase III)